MSNYVSSRIISTAQDAIRESRETNSVIYCENTDENQSLLQFFASDWGPTPGALEYVGYEFPQGRMTAVWHVIIAL